MLPEQQDKQPYEQHRKAHKGCQSDDGCAALFLHCTGLARKHKPRQEEGEQCDEPPHGRAPRVGAGVYG